MVSVGSVIFTSTSPDNSLALSIPSLFISSINVILGASERAELSSSSCNAKAAIPPIASAPRTYGHQPYPVSATVGEDVATAATGVPLEYPRLL